MKRVIPDKAPADSCKKQQGGNDDNANVYTFDDTNRSFLRV
ncbi:hypothetical protein [Candidatus Pristimantibacillus sp. PTI5]